MSPDSIVAQAIEIASAQERAAVLETACRGQPELQHEVEQLVRDHFRAGAFLERLAAADDPAAAEPVQKILQHRLDDPDLSGGRDAKELAELPDAGRQRWMQLSGEVRDRVRRAGKK